MQSETYREMPTVRVWWFALAAIPYLLTAMLMARVIISISPGMLHGLVATIGYANVPTLAKAFTRGIGSSYAMALATLLSPLAVYTVLFVWWGRRTVGEVQVFLYVNLILLVTTIVFCALAYPYLQVMLPV
jgi:hypothetical protein